MSIASVNRRNKRKKTQALIIAASVIDKSGIVPLIQDAYPPASPRGRKPHLPQYELRAILITMFYLAYRGTQISWANVVHTLWFELKPRHLQLLGLPENWQNKARQKELKQARPKITPTTKPTGATGHPSPTRRSPWDNEYLRLWKFLNKALTPIDDTTKSGNTKQTETNVRAARTDPDTDRARALRLQCLNALIRGSLEHANSEHRPELPPRAIHEGILRHHKGDLAVDEHLFAVGLTRNAVWELNNIKQLADRSAHIRRERKADAIGITVATTAYRPDNPRIPVVAIGIDIHPGVTGASQGARNAIDAVEEQGMRPRLASTARQYVIGDKAYPYYVGFTDWLLDHSYTLHAKLPKTMHKVHDLAPADEPLTSGPYLTRGRVLCPGIGAGYLHNIAAIDVPNEKELTAMKLRNHEPIEDQLHAALMPTNGRPERVKAKKRGRPTDNAPPIEDLRRITVYCPAAMANPKARCPIVLDSMDLDPATTPTIQNPPPPATRPTACRTGTQTVTINTEQTKTLLHYIDGTWDHQDLYATTRSLNEAYFNRLMAPNTGNLRLGAIDFDKNAPVAIAIAMTIAVTNLQIIDKHEENYGKTPPRGLGAARRAFRHKIRNGQIKPKRHNRTGRNDPETDAA